MSEQNPALRELLGVSRNIANRTRTNADASPCVDCKRTLTILPLRYGVVSGSDRTTAKQLAPALPAHLGKKLTPKLKESRYAVRSMREGYLYVFLQRTGKPYVCESAYRVHDNALLQPVWPDNPSLPIDRFRELGRWTIKVGDPQDVEEARLLFTPDPLSPAMINRYRDVDRYRNRMQKFDLRTLAVSCGLFDDVIIPSNVDSTVAEFLAVGNDAATAMLENQAFPPFRSALTPVETVSETDSKTPQVMNSIYRNALDSLMGGGGVALVLDDPIGIVQELNAWRNDSVEMNIPWLKETNKEGITNERMHAVAGALDNIETAMRQGYIENAVKEAAEELREARQRDYFYKTRIGMGLENLKELEEKYDPEAVRKRASDDAPEEAFKRYRLLLNVKAKTHVQSEFATRDKNAQAEMDKREVDHLAWLKHKAVIDAFDLYDRKDAVWGQAFMEQVGLCLLGMNGCDSGTAKLAEWWSDIKIDEKNLAWRALTRNQTEIREATAIANAQAAAGEPLTAENMVAKLATINSVFKNVAELLGKADDAVERAMMAGTHNWFGANRLSRSLSLFAQAHQYLFKLLPGNAVDRRVLAPMLGYIHANLGQRVTNLRLEELAAAGRTASEARVRGQVNSRITGVRNTLTADFQNGGGGHFYKVRAGVVVAIIESIALLTTAGRADKQTKDYAELLAAGLVTAAAGLELTASGVEVVTTRYAASTVVGRGSAIALGGLKIAGGSLASVGGGIGAAVSLVDASDAFRNDRRTLGYAYLGQAIVSTAITSLGAMLSLSASGAYLEWLLMNTQRAFLRAILPTVIRWSAALAVTEIAAMLGLALGIATVLGVIAAFVIWRISPDDLEVWCRHSSLGKRKEDDFWKPYESEELELQRLYAAFEAVK